MDRQQAAKEEMQNRQYLYGGLRPITGPFVGERREILSPEMNINMGPTLDGGYNIKTIPAEYGPVEYDSSYAPVNRGLSSLNDLFFGDANEQAAVVNQAGSALKNVLTSMPEYFSNQVTAAASGGEYFDPDTTQITQFDPTIVLAGGNPATSGSMTLGSGIRAPSSRKTRPFEQYGGSLADARKALNLTTEDGISFRKSRKGFKSETPPEVRDAAQKVYDGDMNISEYNDIVQKKMPPEPIGQVLDVPNVNEIALALDKQADKSAGIIGFNVNIPDGTPASSRLDINAYEKQGTWVATVHEGGKKAGSVLGYGPTAVLNDVSFKSNPGVALDIARGKKSKSTIGRMDGTWENRDPNLVEQQVKDILNGKAPDANQWVEFGMNPARGSGFYDKRTGQRLGETEQVLQIGPLVLAKNPTRIELDDPRNLVTERGKPKLNKQNEPIFFSGGGRTGGVISGGSALRNITGPMPEVTRDTPLLQNVGDVDRVNNLVVERTAPQLTEVPIVKAEDLIDRYYTTGITDTSNSDLSTITAVNGIPVSSRQQGGAFFGFQPENIELGHIFASAEKPVDVMLSRGRYAEALSGRPPVFIPYGMVGPSTDFATMMTDIMVPYGRQNMSKTNKIALDKRIREGKGNMLGLPDWPGIDKATPGYMQSLGDSRKRVLFGMEEFRDKGSLGISEVRALVTDPNQFDPKFGNINAVYEMDIARGKEPGLHPTYSHSFFGTPLGGFSSPANILDMDLKMGMRKDQKDYLTEMARRQSLQSPEKKHLHNVDIGGKVGSAAQAAIRAGAQGRITRDMVDELIRQGKVIP